MHEGSHFSISLPTIVICRLLIIVILTSVRLYLAMVWSAFLWWLMMFSTIFMPLVFFGEISIQFFCFLKQTVWLFLYLSCINSLCILDIKSTLDILFIISFPIQKVVFSLVVSFAVKKLFYCNMVLNDYLCFCFPCPEIHIQKYY